MTDKPPDANAISKVGGPAALRAASDAAPTITNEADLEKAKSNGTPVNTYAASAADKVPAIVAGFEPSKPITILSSGDFVRGFQPPDYVIDGIIQRGCAYWNTGKTGSGKTAVGLRLLAHVALGWSIAGHGVTQGTCLMFVGENPDGVRARWVALAEQMGFIADDIPVYFVAGVFSIPEMRAVIEQKADDLGGLSVVLVDTSAAYFKGEDENSNVQAGDHARMLRSITEYPGHPAVIVNCHPTKKASDDELQPRGGGAQLAEFDGNLTTQKVDATVILHWQAKIRGPEFAPITFDLIPVTSDLLVDSKGRHIPTVYVRPLTDSEAASREAATDRDLIKLVVVMAANPGASIADLAVKAGWQTSGGDPQKSKVHRMLTALKNDGLVYKAANWWTLTTKGQKAAKSPEP